MVWLAIDTTTQIATYALKVGDKIYQKQQLGATTHAKTILSLITDLMHEAGVQLKDIQGIVVGRGPGSFTGLRVACAVVKGLAFPYDIPIYPVSNLALVAWSVRKKYPSACVLSLIDARMQQVYWAIYEKDVWHAEEHVDCVSKIKAPTKSFVLAGYHFHEYQALIPSTWSIIAEEHVEPDASMMIEMLASNLIDAVDVAALEPIYVREQITQGQKNG